VRVLIVSDLHANLEALRALPEDCDELWVLGDLVNYGPNPCEVVDFVRARASVVVRGNHDHAIGHGVDPRCSPRFQEMAGAVQAFSEAVLGEERKQYLRALPLTAGRTLGGRSIFLCHATPSDPLYKYCPPDSPEWPSEAGRPGADVILTGHTHLPFQRIVAGRLVVNPGSLGQPKHGCPEACYAVWEDGRFLLESRPYHVSETVRKVLELPIGKDLAGQLAAVLKTGAPPR